jgi:hypothetical protein
MNVPVVLIGSVLAPPPVLPLSMDLARDMTRVRHDALGMDPLLLEDSRPDVPGDGEEGGPTNDIVP